MLVIKSRGLDRDLFKHLDSFDLDEREDADDGSESIFFKDITISSHYIVMKGVLKDMNFLKFSNWQSFTTLDPTAILSAPKRVPELYEDRAQRAEDCLEMESLLGDPTVVTKVGLLREGQPLLRFSRMLVRPIAKHVAGDGAPRHAYARESHGKFVHAVIKQRGRLGFPSPFTERTVSMHEDGCWLTQPLPIYIGGRLMEPIDYKLILPLALVEVRSTVTYRKDSDGQVFYLDVQEVHVIKKRAIWLTVI